MATTEMNCLASGSAPNEWIEATYSNSNKTVTFSGWNGEAKSFVITCNWYNTATFVIIYGDVSKGKISIATTGNALAIGTPSTMGFPTASFTGSEITLGRSDNLSFANAYLLPSPNTSPLSDTM